MNIFDRVRTIALACALTLTASAAASPPAPFDNEQQAATDIRAAERIQGEVPYLHFAFILDGFNYGNSVLRALAAATTPAALARTPGGVTLTCISGGSFTAHSTRSTPRDIEVEFHDCRPFRTFQGMASGPMRLTLLSDSFTAGVFGGIRQGIADRDLVVSWTLQLPGVTQYHTWNYNVDMQGRIQWPLQGHADMVPRLASFEFNGTMLYVARTEPPGQQPSTVTRYVADHVFMSTSTTDGNDFNYIDEQFDYVSGAITIEVGPPAPRSTTRYDLAGLNWRRVQDFATWTDAAELSGGVRYSYVNGDGTASCLGGDYLFRTKTPLHRSNLDSVAYDSGELIINRDVRMRLYSAQNVPAGLPVPVNGMLVHVDLANGESFDYDSPGSISSGLPAPLPCAF
jgi:hypothetical protein